MSPSASTEQRRILLKLSGEALSGGKGFGIDTDALGQTCDELADVSRAGVQIGVVIRHRQGTDPGLEVLLLTPAGGCSLPSRSVAETW